MVKADKKGKKSKKNAGNTRSLSVKNVLTGGLVHSDFFFRHKLTIFVALALIMFYISTKYQCQTGMETIRQLQRELDVVKTECIREKSLYMSRIRESAMAALADSIRPGLVIQQQPPFRLKLNK